MRKFIIYQIVSQAEAAHGIIFTPLDSLEKFGLREKLNLSLYDVVYQGTLEDDLELEDIYTAFQDRHHDGFKGHSLSISDIIEMEGKLYYCDRYDFKEISLPDVKPTIHKGDKFLCRKDYLTENNIVAYMKGRVYLSELDDCITSENGSVRQQMNEKTNFYQFFAKIA